MVVFLRCLNGIYYQHRHAWRRHLPFTLGDDDGYLLLFGWFSRVLLLRRYQYEVRSSSVVCSLKVRSFVLPIKNSEICLIFMFFSLLMAMVTFIIFTDFNWRVVMITRKHQFFTWLGPETVLWAEIILGPFDLRWNKLGFVLVSYQDAFGAKLQTVSLLIGQAGTGSNHATVFTWASKRVAVNFI